MLGRGIRYLNLSILFVGISGAAFVLIPLCSGLGQKAEQLATVLVAGLFWSSLILWQVFFWKADSCRKNHQKSDKPRRIYKKRPVGALAFGSNREAMVCDAILGGAAVLTAVLLLLNVKQAWIVIPCVTVLYVSFCLHCLFNGTTYQYIKDREQQKRS